MLSASIKCKKLDLARTNRLSIDYSTLLFLLFYYNDKYTARDSGCLWVFLVKKFHLKKGLKIELNFVYTFLPNKTDFSFSKTVDGIIAASDYKYTDCLIKFA